ncbi:metallophosphoesterase [Guggenheimella bovis]
MLFLLIFLILITLISYIENRFFIVESLSIPWKEDLKVIQLSDFHENPLIDIPTLVKNITNRTPDVIVFTGDLFDRKSKCFKRTKELLLALKEGHEVFGILGNHELESKLLRDYVKWLKENDLLLDEARTVKNTTFSNYIIEASDILLCHDPMHSLQSPSKLTLSGHTHGGQVNFFGLVVKVPGQGFFPKYVRGLYNIGRKLLYIDSGLGFTFLPLRVLRPVQVSQISLERNKKTSV